MEYSPAEDWERNSNYCPRVDFLTADYLQGVPQAENPAWKAFFEKANVKERGDNTLVGDFAVEFVKYKLSMELTSFVSKERLQHGYDLEARRITEGAIVCLEVKGQRKEGPVELVGNEPVAAQQAKQKNQEYWLCVVPGIPENPQLWVINDRLNAGEFKTITIDSSRWKRHGRRVI
ncbi:MAG TPA: DUF3883 domain-containing protein [Terriglobia bacterium]|nr:DUF3883 domain-containing protein [Terriglobia bacterium]